MADQSGARENELSSYLQQRKLPEVANLFESAFDFSFKLERHFGELDVNQNGGISKQELGARLTERMEPELYDVATTLYVHFDEVNGLLNDTHPPHKVFPEITRSNVNQMQKFTRPDSCLQAPSARVVSRGAVNGAIGGGLVSKGMGGKFSEGAGTGAAVGAATGLLAYAAESYAYNKITGAQKVLDSFVEVAKSTCQTMGKDFADERFRVPRVKQTQFADRNALVRGDLSNLGTPGAMNLSASSLLEGSGTAQATSQLLENARFIRESVNQTINSRTNQKGSDYYQNFGSAQKSAVVEQITKFQKYFSQIDLDQDKYLGADELVSAIKSKRIPDDVKSTAGIFAKELESLSRLEYTGSYYGSKIDIADVEAAKHIFDKAPLFDRIARNAKIGTIATLFGACGAGWGVGLGALSGEIKVAAVAGGIIFAGVSGTIAHYLTPKVDPIAKRLGANQAYSLRHHMRYLAK